MPRLLIALVAALALGVTVTASSHDSGVVAAQSPTITVSPDSGNQFQTFTFTGSGFVPGTLLRETYLSPDGDEYTFFINGVEAVIEVGGDGTFSVDVLPSVDFEGAREGGWTVQFCIVGTGDCWSGVVNIAA